MATTRSTGPGGCDCGLCRRSKLDGLAGLNMSPGLQMAVDKAWPTTYTTTYTPMLKYGGMTKGPFNETPIKKEKKMSVANKLKDLTRNKDDRLLLKWGIMREDGSLTGEGSEALENLLFEKFKTELVAQVQQLEDEAKKAKK